MINGTKAGVRLATWVDMDTRSLEQKAGVNSWSLRLAWGHVSRGVWAWEKDLQCLPG